MKIVVGLGNPGARYETTRHNAGFLAIDWLCDEWKATGPDKGFNAELFTASVAGEKVILAKPATFMNNSGRCVGPLLKFYKCEPEDLIVIHDDVDLKPVTLRVKTGGGTGGHNGLKSIDAHLGSEMTNYHRIRIGVGRPVLGDPSGSKIDTADYVLQPFTEDELNRLEPLFRRVTEAAALLIEGNARAAMNRFNVAEAVVKRE